MASYRLILTLFLVIVYLFHGLYSQSTSVGQNAFDSLAALGCTQMKSIIMEAGRQNTYTKAAPLTLFAFNDTAWERLPPHIRSSLFVRDGDNNRGAQEYIDALTLNNVLETSSFSAAAPIRTRSTQNRRLFLNKKALREGGVASGRAGPTQYFVNGAVVIQPNIQAGQHIIHILDRVIPQSLQHNVMAYTLGDNPDSLQYDFYLEFMKKMAEAPQDDAVNNFDIQVQSVLTNLAQPVTFFLPTNSAMKNIPAERRRELLGNTRLLLKIITLHIVPGHVLYTSLVNHNEQFRTQYNSGNVVFRKNFDREAVYVTGALSGGKTVTARMSPSNITVLNGVVHHIDEVLGFVFKDVMQEIATDPITQNFEAIATRGRADLISKMQATSGVYVFAPTNDAINAVKNRIENYINDQSIINKILEYSMLQSDQFISLTGHNGGYESFNTAKSRYNNQLIKIYSEGNDTWVEGGYVKARVVKPDIGCTNGVVHQIDAVFGVETRDIPYLIYCEDWLASTFIQMQFVGLDNYMRDPDLRYNQACYRSSGYQSGSGVPNDGNYGNTGIRSSGASSSKVYDRYAGICGDQVQRCEFTYFVPNGTAIDNFAKTTYGREVMEDVQRWRWIMRRLMTFEKKIYLDRLAPGQQLVMYADNGDEVVIRTDTRSNIPSGRRSAYIYYEGVQARVIHSDLGATNGVVHIIDSLLFVPDDLTRDVSAAPRLTTTLSYFSCAAAVVVMTMAARFVL